MDNLKELSIDDIKQEFYSCGLSYTGKSLKFLIDNHKSLAEVTRTGDPEATVFLIAAGCERKTADEAYEVIEKMRKVGVPFEVVHSLAMEKGREDGFFMNQRGLDILQGMSTKKDVLNNKEVTETMLSVLKEYTDNMNTLVNKH